MRALCVEALTVEYRQGEPVVSNVSFTVPAGEITALLGPNGSGKSTILKSIIGLQPSTGHIALGDIPLTQLAARERAQHIAYVPQKTALQSPLPVQRVVELGRYAHWSGLNGLTAEGARLVKEAMQQTEVDHLKMRPFTHLSGGEQQRVLLARAIASGAKTLVLDEPTSALDIYHSLRFRRLLSELKAAGYTVLAVLHDLLEAKETAHHGILLSRGEVVTSGPIDTVVAPEPLHAAYGVHATYRQSLRFALDPS